jgi:hypothetical protein
MYPRVQEQRETRILAFGKEYLLPQHVSIRPQQLDFFLAGYPTRQGFIRRVSPTSILPSGWNPDKAPLNQPYVGGKTDGTLHSLSAF